MPLCLGSMRPSSTTEGILVGSRPACWPVPKRKSTASWPSLATKTSFAMLDLRSARRVSSSSFALSSTSRIVFSIIVSPALPAAPSVEFRGGRPERAGPEQLRHRLGVSGGGKEGPLGLITTVHAQEFQLPHALHSPGDPPHPHARRGRGHARGG